MNIIFATIKISVLFLLLLFLPLSAEETDKAEELCGILTPREDIINELASGFDYYFESLYSSGLDNETLAELREVFEEFTYKISDDPDLMPKLSAVYSRLFTDTELDEIISFYKSPAGEKMLRKVPEIYAEASAIGEEIALKYQAWLETEINRITGE